MVRNSFFSAALLGAAASLADAACVKPTGNSAASAGSTTSTTAASPGTGNSSSSSGLVASTYFAGYHIDDNPSFPVSDIPWEKYTEVIYAFAETTADGSLDLSKSSPDQIPAFVSAAKEKGVKALISVGGWTGSRFFSTNFGSAANRTAFAKVCMDLVNQYDLDGLDFDFEYPNRQGLGCNAISANDTTNYLSFLQELRQLPGASNLTLTAAGSLFPWNNAEGSQSADVSGFADVLDHIMIMNYDLFGRWASTAGPNAPLASACDATRNNQGSATAGIDAWIASGMPADKLVLGLGAYGHGFRVNSSAALGSGSGSNGSTSSASASASLNMYPAFNASDLFQGSSWDDDPPVDVCGNAQSPGGTYTFWSMITEAGLLDETGAPREGIVYGFDNCSQTPAVWNATSEIWVSYDSAESIAIKGQYILDTGLKGFGLWETGGDYKNILVDSARKSVGLA